MRAGMFWDAQASYDHGVGESSYAELASQGIPCFHQPSVLCYKPCTIVLCVN